MKQFLKVYKYALADNETEVLLFRIQLKEK